MPPQPSPLLPLFPLQLSPIGNVICLVHKPFLVCSPTFNKLVICFMQKTTTKQNKAKHFFSQIKVEWQPPLPSPLLQWTQYLAYLGRARSNNIFSRLFPDSSKCLENYQHHLLHMKTWTSCACSLDCCTALTSEWMESNTSLKMLVPPISKRVSRLKLNLSFLP